MTENILNRERRKMSDEEECEIVQYNDDLVKKARNTISAGNEMMKSCNAKCPKLFPLSWKRSYLSTVACLQLISKRLINLHTNLSHYQPLLTLKMELSLPSKGPFPNRKSEVVFSTETISLGVFFSKNRLEHKPRNVDSEAVFVSCRLVS